MRPVDVAPGQAPSLPILPPRPHRRLRGVVTLAGALWLAGSLACAGHHTPQNATTGDKIESGIASWYGPGFHGRRTANGEVYDMHGLTAAHRTLPFGTKVRVYNRDNGQSVTVRINDRGPFVRGRIIDLSRTAAEAIEMIGPGTARVDLYLVGSTATAASGGVPLRASYTVQVGAFREYQRAAELAGELRGKYPDVRIESGGGWHRVRVGSFSRRRQAEDMRRELLRRKLPAVVLEES